MQIPFIDLKAQYESIKMDIDNIMHQVFAEAAFAGGKFVHGFEQDFAEYCGRRFCIGVGSGTEALWLTLLALGVGPGDEVITVPNTFIATAEAITLCGARPAFVDIDENTYTMNPQKLYDYLQIRNRDRDSRKKIKCIIPVHIFGQMADMDPILEIARAENIFVLEDACQAHGALYKNLPAGSMGDAGCFSFYPGKNLGAYGEAGAIVTDNEKISNIVSTFRDHGQSKKYHHIMFGWNARMDGIQGAVLSVKLRYLDRWNNARREAANLYNLLLKNIENRILPFEADYAKHVYHIYAVRVKKRDGLIRSLSEKGIHCGIHYPVPIHLTDAYHFLGYKKNSFPVAERCAEQMISLPMYPELDGKQIVHIANEIMELLMKKKHSEQVPEYPENEGQI